MVSPSLSDSSERSLAEKSYLALATPKYFMLPPAGNSPHCSIVLKVFLKNEPHMSHFCLSGLLVWMTCKRDADCQYLVQHFVCCWTSCFALVACKACVTWCPHPENILLGSSAGKTESYPKKKKKKTHTRR